MLQILLDNVVSNIKLSSRSHTDGKGERRKGIRVRTFEHWELEVMGLGVETQEMEGSSAESEISRLRECGVPGPDMRTSLTYWGGGGGSKQGD